MHKTLIVASACVSLIPATASSQMLDARQQERLSEARVAQADPSISSPYALPLPLVTLETVTGGGQAKATIGFARGESTYRLTFRSPIGAGEDAEANPLSLKGLGNAATVEVAHSRLFLFKRYTDQQLLDFCKAEGVPPSKCSDQAFANEETRRRFIGIALRRRPSLLTVSGQAGGHQFRFLDRTTLAPQSKKYTSAEGTIGYAMLLLPDSLVGVNYTFARDFHSSSDKTSVCRPLTDATVPGALRCDQTILGAPSGAETSVLTVEYRRQIIKDNAPIFGVSAQLHVDFVDKNRTAVEVPVYFLQKKPDKDSGVSLNGGVNSGWSSEEGFVVKVFIGTAFKLITQ